MAASPTSPWPGKRADQHNLLMSNVCDTGVCSQTVGPGGSSRARDFSRAFAGDSSSIILNQAALNLIALKSPLQVRLPTAAEANPTRSSASLATMIRESPLQTRIPFLLRPRDNILAPSRSSYRPGSPPMRPSLPKCSAISKQYNPSSPFTYAFVDDRLRQEIRNRRTHRQTRRLLRRHKYLHLLLSGSMVS